MGLPSIAAALLLQASAPASAPRPADEGPTLAIRVKRAETVSGGPIENATILVRGGRIAAVGPNLPVSSRATTIDARDLVATPGWVLPTSRHGMSPGRGRAVNAHLRALDELYPFDPLWKELLERGATTIAVTPFGGGIAGRGAIVRPRGESAAAMALVPDAFLAMDLELNTAAKQLLKQAFTNAKRELEKLEKARKDWDEARKKAAESRPASGPASQPASAPASAPAEFKPPPVDPKLDPLVRLLERKTRALVAVSSPAEVLHFLEVAKEVEFDRAWVGTPLLYLAADRIGSAKDFVVLPAEIGFEPQTRNRVNAARVLAQAGARVAFVPSPPGPEGIEAYPFRVAELVKAGLDRATALRAMTLTPAELLGVADRVGSIEEGKDANLLFFDGDPFEPRSRLRKVMLEGTLVHEVAP